MLLSPGASIIVWHECHWSCSLPRDHKVVAKSLSLKNNFSLFKSEVARADCFILLHNFRSRFSSYYHFFKSILDGKYLKWKRRLIAYHLLEGQAFSRKFHRYFHPVCEQQPGERHWYSVLAPFLWVHPVAFAWKTGSTFVAAFELLEPWDELKITHAI